jgi:hypothetical protein
MLFRSGRQHLERRIRHGRFSRPPAPRAASQTVEAVSPCCLLAVVTAELAPGVSVGRLDETSARRPGPPRLRTQGSARRQLGARGLLTVVVGRFPLVPDCCGLPESEGDSPWSVTVHRPLTFLSSLPDRRPPPFSVGLPRRSMRSNARVLCGIRPGADPSHGDGTVGPGRSNSRSAGQAQDSVARAWRQLRGSQAQHRWPARPTKARRNCLRQRQPNASLRIDASVAVMALACLRACQGWSNECCGTG